MDTKQPQLQKVDAKKLTRRIVDHLYKMDDVETLLQVAHLLKIKIS